VDAAVLPVAAAIPLPAVALPEYDNAALPSANSGNAIFYLFLASSAFFLRCSINILT
jgi:hypothetical protein